MKKNILVTGSSRGIGLAIAKHLKSEGYNVVINGRFKSSLSKIKREHKIKFVCGDFSDPIKAKNIIKKTKIILKTIDVLVCNIGESKSCPPNKETYNEWKKMFAQNFFSASNAIENCKNEIIKNKGKIICISAGAGSKFIKGAPITYSTAKAALSFYAKSLAYYLGKEGVRLNVISPGNTLFEGSTWDKKIKKNLNSVKKLIKETVPLNKFAKTQDIADMVSYLISEKGDFVNGANIVIDGGQTI